MSDRVFTIPFHIPGTLAANLTIKFTMPFDAQLIHAQAVASNDSDATWTLGNSVTADAYLLSCVIGDSGVPVEKSRANFVGTQYPHIADGVIFAIAVDFDGSAGTAAQNVTIVLTFTEG